MRKCHFECKAEKAKKQLIQPLISAVRKTFRFFQKIVSKSVNRLRKKR